MGNELEISANGHSSVAVEELYDASQKFAVLAREASELVLLLGAIHGQPAWWFGATAPPSLIRAQRSIEHGRAVISGLELESRMLHAALNSAAEGYGFVELYLRDLLGGTLGTVASLPAMLSNGVDRNDLSTVLSRAASVSVVRAGAMGIDDVLMQLAGVPLPLAQFVGDNGLGLMGLPVAAATVMGVGSLVGVLKETPVALVSTTTLPPRTAATGFAQRLDRIPDPATNNGSQVVIEKYEVPGQPDQFEVYIAGTASWQVADSTEPWDMTSNMGNTAGPGSGSYDSVVIAMKDAGITASSPVQFTGYSQGGGTAAQLAASGDYNTVGLVTFGAPTGQIAVPEQVPTVLVEHRDDIVPALGGNQDNDHAVIVERDVFEGMNVPTELAIPAHHREYYLETAQLMDASANAELAASRGTLDTVTSDPRSTVTSTAYRFERVSPG